MGLWSSIKRVFGGSPAAVSGGGPDAADAPALVILVRDPIMPTEQFIQGAVMSSLGHSLTVGDPHSTNFVAGQPPFFFIQYGGRVLQIKFIPRPFFDPECRVLLSHDPGLLLTKIGRDAALKKAVAEHTGFIAVTCMNWRDQRAWTEDPYLDVAVMMSAFSLVQDLAAIIWPNRAEIRLWEFDMQEMLEDGDLQAIFNETKDR